MCRSSTKQTYTQPQHNIRYVEAENSSSDECTDEYAYMTSQGETVSVKVGNMPITMLIESGSTCNIIKSAYKQQLVRQGVEITACNRKLHPYSSPAIEVRQLMRMDIALVDGHVVSGEFLIVEGDAMLGKVTAEQLGILQVGECIT